LEQQVTQAPAGGGSTPPLGICPYCREIVGSPRSFASSWHVGTSDDVPSCCVTGHYLRQQAQRQQAPPPQSSGPINIASPARGGQTSPLIIVDESR
jgi:hypothetical protein